MFILMRNWSSRMSHGRPWTDAHSLNTFGEYTAQWLEGQIDHMPTRVHYKEVHAETARLVPFLAAANRSGSFITTDSQPGCALHRRTWGGMYNVQRAAVMGFVPPSAIDRVRKTLIQTGIQVRVAPPGSASRHEMLLVSRHEGRDVTWYGEVLSREEIARNYGGVPGHLEMPGLHVKVIRALQNCYQVMVADGMWARNVLWPALQELA
jgi:hypothetical protein